MSKFYTMLAVLAFFVSNVQLKAADGGWKQLGKGTFCDDMFYVLNSDYLDTWEVDIEESEEIPGYYRLKNPFGNGNCPYFSTAFEGGDLYIHAEDPEHVWMPFQSLGFSAGEFGSVSVSCMVGLYIYSDIFTLEELLDPDYGIEFGSLRDGKITFPDNDWYLLQVSFSNYLEGTPADGNTNNKFLVTLPQSSVDTPLIDMTDAPVEYYNLQGIKVDSPATGNVYIRRQGVHVSKIIF